MIVEMSQKISELEKLESDLKKIGFSDSAMTEAIVHTLRAQNKIAVAMGNIKEVQNQAGLQLQALAARRQEILRNRERGLLTEAQFAAAKAEIQRLEAEARQLARNPGGPPGGGPP